MQKISFTYKGEIMIHVLIIEDEPAIARGLSLLITKNYPDFQVLGICKNGRDGLRKSWSRNRSWYLLISPCL